MHTIAADNNVSFADPVFENNSDPVTVFNDFCYTLGSPDFRFVWKILIQDLMISVSLEYSETVTVPCGETLLLGDPGNCYTLTQKRLC